MNNERVSEYLLGLPHVQQTVQWGDNLVFWVGDKAVGGKMFCMLNLDPGAKCRAGFAAGPEGMAELCERESIVPAPYLARAHWVCVQQWDALSWAEWKQCLARAHGLIQAKLPRRTRDVLAMEPKARAAVIRQRRKLLAEKRKAEQ
jgi:predicted DNA-binding protein (MmcQ/YjbR family)